LPRTRPEPEIDGRTRRVLLEQTPGVDITKLNNWIGVLDDDEIDALDDALAFTTASSSAARGHKPALTIVLKTIL
jgi:hypothetical protein